jgi:fructose-bisphosphate aldolase class I
MYDAVHKMRSRIITSPGFTGDKVIGAILFEDTMDREIDGLPTGQYLWEKKGIVPFLKIDKGLLEEEKGVQLMKPIPGLDDLLERAKKNGFYGTKMRSVINSAVEEGIKAIVEQQFQVAKQVIDHELIPIIEPEVNIKAPDKAVCEELLKKYLLAHLDLLGDNDRVMLKLTIPTKINLYAECIRHPKCVRVVALSGGYSCDEAARLLSKQKGMIASFSRALAEKLSHSMSDEEFHKTLAEACDIIYNASKAGE